MKVKGHAVYDFSSHESIEYPRKDHCIDSLHTVMQIFIGFMLLCQGHSVKPTAGGVTQLLIQRIPCQIKAIALTKKKKNTALEFICISKQHIQDSIDERITFNSFLKDVVFFCFFSACKFNDTYERKNYVLQSQQNCFYHLFIFLLVFAQVY